MLPLTRMLDEGGGFGFTWPAQAPVVRIDHVFVRGLDTTSTEVLPANGSDHRGLRVGLRG
jgi:vancomycin resistance protein VanJ